MSPLTSNIASGLPLLAIMLDAISANRTLVSLSGSLRLKKMFAVMPALLLFAGAPMLLALCLGFFDVSGFGGYRFVGLANYRRMLHDPLFLQSLEVTLAYTVMLVCSGLGSITGALIVAAMARRRGLGKSAIIMLGAFGATIVAFALSSTCAGIVFVYFCPRTSIGPESPSHSTLIVRSRSPANQSLPARGGYTGGTCCGCRCM